MATVKANGYTHIPAPVEGYEAGTMVEVLMTTDPGSIERTLIFTGSLDPALEELAGLAHDSGLFIHATNPGNISGILALKNTSCHAAPLVLPAGPHLAEYRPLTSCHDCGTLSFIHIATIELGIASRDGIGIQDIKKVRFINTRKDTPSRTILDSLLAAEGINPSEVNGYLQEVHSHLAVAAAIRDGFADAGICTSSVAQANGLGFVPLAHEDYELTIRREMLADPRIRMLVSIIRSPEYHTALTQTGGYDVSLTGTIRGLNERNTLSPCSPESLPAGYL
jgi:putative molybdopterin biosynthesis protein